MTTVGHIRNELLATFRKNPNIDYSVQTLSRALKLSAWTMMFMYRR